MSKIIPFRAGPEDVDNVVAIHDSIYRRSGGAVDPSVSEVVRFALAFAADCARADEAAVSEDQE